MGLLKRVLLLLSLSACTGAFAATYHVFPAGTDIKKHRMDAAYATTDITRAIGLLKPGDTVYLRSGTHQYTGTIYFNKSGTPRARICLCTYPGERAEFDFTGNGGPGMVSDASYTDYVDQTFKGASKVGLQINGSNNKVLRCKFLENGSTGLQIEGSNNTITNCDSYYNKDSEEGEADGFAPKLDVGSGNKFIGCRAWQNSDDGWDGYLKESKDVSQSFENCWAFKNGYLKSGSPSKGNGNGFKSGSATGTQNWTMKNCVAYGNLSKGFDQNHNKGSLTLYNCSSMDNVRYDYMENEQLASGKSATIKNCLQFRTKKSTAPGPDSVGIKIGAFVQVAGCSWLGGMKAVESDFVSIDPSELASARKSDGSLPDIKFLHLKQGSRLVDAGVEVGLPHKGKAPDIGAFESEFTTGTENAVSPPREGMRWNVLPGAGVIRVEFSLPEARRMTISLHELSGKRTLPSVTIHGAGGENSYSLDVRRLNPSVSAGMYLLTLRGDFPRQETKRVFLGATE